MTQADDNPVADSPHPEETGQDAVIDEGVKAKQTVRDNGDGRKWFTMLPNICDDDMDAYAYRLYGHYKRVCGEDGECWEATRTTAKACKMGPATVVKYRNWLKEHKWIEVEYPQRSGDAMTVTLLDKWAENFERNRARSRSERPVRHANGSGAGKRSPREPKNNRVTKNAGAGERPRDAIFDFLAGEVFGVKDTAALGKAGAGRVAKLKAVVRDRLEAEAEEDVLRHLKAFVRWYYGRYEGISLPRDVQKFDVFWAQYITGPGAQVETPVADEDPWEDMT